MCFSLSFLARGGRGRFPPSRLRSALTFMPMGCDLGGPRRRRCAALGRGVRWGGFGGGDDGMDPIGSLCPPSPAPIPQAGGCWGAGCPPQTPRGASCSRGPPLPPPPPHRLVLRSHPHCPDWGCPVTPPRCTRGVGGVVGTHRAAPSPPCRAPCTMLAVMGQQGWDLPRALVPPPCALGVRVPTSAPCTLVQTRAHPYGHCACAACCCTCTLQATRCWGPCTCCVSHRCDVTHTRGLGVNTTPPTSPRGGGGLRGSHEPP